MDELGFEVIRKVKIWLNLVAFARAPLFWEVADKQ